MHLLKSLRPFAVVLIGLALANPVGDAEAAVITLDGIKDSSDPGYATTKSVLWFNDHQGTQFCSGCDPLQTTDVQYGTGTLAGGDSTEYFFVYMEALSRPRTWCGAMAHRMQRSRSTISNSIRTILR